MPPPDRPDTADQPDAELADMPDVELETLLMLRLLDVRLTSHASANGQSALRNQPIKASLTH